MTIHRVKVIFKVVDAAMMPGAPDSADLLAHEAHACAHLQDLQGVVIPMQYGLYSVGDSTAPCSATCW
jgi:hypothetical protein